MDGSLHPLQLIHQGLIHMEPAGGVQEDHITAVVPGMADCILCNLHRVTLTLLEYRQVQLATHHLQLLDGGGTVHVAGGQQGPLAKLAAHQPRQLGGGGGLAGALQAHHHHNGGTAVGHGEPGGAAAHELCQLFVDDLDDLLGGREAVQHVGPHSPLCHGSHEVLDHLIAYVGLQQGQTDFPHGLPDVVLCQAALAPQLLECCVQFFGEPFKCHAIIPSKRWLPRESIPPAQSDGGPHTGGS